MTTPAALHTLRRKPAAFRARLWRWVAGAAVLLVVALALPALRSGPVARGDQDGAAARANWRTVAVARASFQQMVRRIGALKPVSEQRVFAGVAGVIQELAPQGKTVAKDEVVLRLDPKPHEEARSAQDAAIKELDAEFKKTQQEAAKVLNQAKEDVAGYDLRLELETRRLEELKKGPTPTEVINAQVALENSRSLLRAREDELAILEGLAAAGYASKEELRQKQLDVTEQRLSVAQADIRQRKLEIIDPVKLAEQELKVREALKARDAAKERVVLLERNMQRDLEHHQRHMERERDRLKDLTENVAKTVHKAPGPGVVVHRRHRWFAYTPGREVWEGQEILALPDSTKMKVALTVDEANVGDTSVGQEAYVTPAGWQGEPFRGKVNRVAEKGRDEFEMFSDETTALSGTANRQVFDVEVEIDSQDAALRPGLRADVQIVVRTLADKLVAPRAAVTHDKDGVLIVQVDGGGEPERRPVKVLAENDFSVVVEGVKEGERVWVVEP